MGGVAFLIASMFIVRDRGQAEVATLGTSRFLRIFLEGTDLCYSDGSVGQLRYG